MLDSLIWNSSEAIKVTSARVGVKVEKAVRVYRIKEVLVGAGNGKLRSRGRIAVHRGSKLRIRVILSKYTGGTKTMNYTPKVRHGPIQAHSRVVRAAPPISTITTSTEATSIAMLEVFQNFPRSDQLVIGIVRPRRERFAPARSTRLDGVVRGYRAITLLPDGSAGPASGSTGTTAAPRRRPSPSSGW